MDINIISAISALGALNGFMIAILLLIRNKNNWVKFPLILYIVMLSVYLLSIVIKYLDLSDHIFQYIYFVDVLYGILIYMYVRNKIANKVIFFKNDLLYIIPIFLFYTYAQIVSLQTGSEVSKWIIAIVVDLFFVFLALRLLYTHIEKQESVVRIKKWKNLKNIILFCLFIDLAELFLFTMYLIYNADIYLYLYANLIYTIAIYVIGVNELLSNAITRKEVKTVPIENKNNLKERLLFLMETEHLHRNKGIKVSDIAERLGEKTTVVSYIVNNEIGMTFPDFINHYRVEDAKKMLMDKNINLSIDGIGYEVGFKSKSPFYIAFKKSTGKTPKKY